MEKDAELKNLYEAKRRGISVKPDQYNIHSYLQAKGLVKIRSGYSDFNYSQLTAIGEAFYADGGFTGETRRRKKKAQRELLKWVIGVAIGIGGLVIAYIKIKCNSS